MGESEFKMLYLEVSSNILPSICWFVTNRDDNVPEELNTKPRSVNYHSHKATLHWRALGLFSQGDQFIPKVAAGTRILSTASFPSFPPFITGMEPFLLALVSFEAWLSNYLCPQDHTGIEPESPPPTAPPQTPQWKENYPEVKRDWAPAEGHLQVDQPKPTKEAALAHLF